MEERKIMPLFCNLGHHHRVFPIIFAQASKEKKHTCVTYDVAMQHNNGLAFVFHKDQMFIGNKDKYKSFNGLLSV